ncbi:hypothetical protein [Nonomuraea terrae]|uniref:hypothetical protein n=1 Tax=Nonomuraea terrae TaxID=2530383 RepID=UPI0014045E75|nr:hypothetical protein [Nonomuraea terrae]
MGDSTQGGRRLFAAGLAGLALATLLVVAAFVTARLYPEDRYCGHYTGCLGQLAAAMELVWDAGRWVAVVLAWPLLRCVGVRPAWPVALLAVPVLIVTWWVALESPFVTRLALLLCSGVIAYPVAAWLATRFRPGG